MVIDMMYANTNLHKYNCHHDLEEEKIFGFWIYLMSDSVLFCCLFATYIVLLNGTANGPTSKDIFELPFVFLETIFLLFSSITYSVVTVATHENNNKKIIFWLSLTWIFGFIFSAMELYEFHDLIVKGFGPNRSGFLSAFFALVGTHGLHVVSGLIWIIVMILQIIIRGLTNVNRTRIMCLSLFWHFLDIIWIFVFSTVYLIGVAYELH